MDVGLVLSGGGARGIMHIGVLKALDEQGINVKAISGVSSGGVVAAFYANGYTPDEIFTFFKNLGFFDFFKPAFSLKGLLNINGLSKKLSNYLPETFDQLKIPISITATNIVKAEAKVFKEGKLIPALLASSAIPFIFKPVEIDGESYLDGGILDNMAMNDLKELHGFVIGAHCNFPNQDRKIGSVKSIMEQTFNLLVHQNTIAVKANCSLVIDPKAMQRFTSFQIKAAEEIFMIGYEETLKELKTFRQRG